MTTLFERPSKLSDRYQLADGEVFIGGVQALVRLPMAQMQADAAAGLDTAVFLSGYEGSPLAGFDLELMRQRELLDQHRVTLVPAVNEELGVDAVFGSQLTSTRDDALHDGVVGIWYGKAPGLDRATDALRHANIGGTSQYGGVLALVGDDAIAKSSTVPSSSEAAMSELGMIVFMPSDPQEVLEYGLHGIAASRFSGLWSGLKLATNVLDGGATVRVQTSQVQPVIPSNVIDGEPYVHQVSGVLLQPGLGALERSLMTSRRELAVRYANANGLNTIIGDPGASLGIITAGATYLDVRQALRRAGIEDAQLDTSGVRILKLGVVSPLDPQIVTTFGDGLSEIVVVEEKRPVIEQSVKDIFYNNRSAPSVYGRRGWDNRELMRPDADLPPAYIAAKIEPFLERYARRTAPSASKKPSVPAPSRRLLPVVQRTPYFCSGCPHSTSTAVPDGSVVGAGIGCSGLVVLMPESQVGDVFGFAQMGGEGAAWIGAAPYLQNKHLIQNMGDGTFHHSGSLAIRAAIAANANITYKILYNDTVAMTGGQDAAGKMDVPAMLSVLHAEGVRQTIITTEDPKRYRRVHLPRGVKVWHRDRVVEAQELLAKVEGVTLLVHDQACATELRRKRKRKQVAAPTTRAFINERVCEGCGDCGRKSNCLSVVPTDTEFGRKTAINQGTCNLDFSCFKGDCPAFVEVTPGSDRAQSQEVTTIEATDIVAPPSRAEKDLFTVRITGIGGTGIVTVSQVVSTAATLAGFYCRSLDQLGMAQKGGAVVSDLILSRTSVAGANKLSADECDLYLGCDLLVAANPTNLEACSADSIPVISTAKVPTGAMVSDVNQSFPDVSEVSAHIRTATGDQAGVFDDMSEFSRALFDSDQYANVLMLGIAVQLGALPLSPAYLEEALRMNGVAVDTNLQAFRRGRLYVADRAAFDQALPAATKTRIEPSRQGELAAATSLADASADLRNLFVRRYDELIEYQSVGYAETFAAAVAGVFRAESAQALGESITTEYVRHLFKLMAYKDEYEVARLSIGPDLGRQIQATFGERARYSLLFQPPSLKAVRFERKIRLGRNPRAALHALYRMRRLRGTPLDPFGRSEVRQAERRLVTEYRETIDAALRELSPANAPLVAALAALPDQIRGYESVKMRNIEQYEIQRRAILDNLTRAGDHDRGATPGAERG